MADTGALAHAARTGDVAALGALLAVHRPSMLAVALSILAQPADAEDAVQDATLIALRRIGDLRDPQAAGPWLKMIVRNCCRARLRSPLPVPMAEPRSWGPDLTADPGRLVEQHVARDWIWPALGQLSQPLRMVVLLRYFSRTTSYEQIAALCGVPVGTVRSRLSKARATLSGLLLASAGPDPHGPDGPTLNRYQDLFADLTSGSPSRAGLRQELDPELETFWAGTRRTVGVDPVVSLLTRSADAGVQLSVVNLLASHDIVVGETDTSNPADRPDHCPPGVAWLLRLKDGRAGQLRLFYEPRSAA